MSLKNMAVNATEDNVVAWGQTKVIFQISKGNTECSG